ncbi:MAG: Asp-tRNA(Asn)/Glu-tRNA(Gln) amidotransferase subunit GatC [Bacilli bacterium]
MFTKEMVDDYAEKLLIGLSDAENALVLKEFDVIDKSMAILANIINISDVEPMTHALDDLEIELREDTEEDSVPIEDLFRNCDNYEDREIVVPKVVE